MNIFKTASKAWAGVAGAAVGASPLGEAVADLVYWVFQHLGLGDVPRDALRVVVVAIVTGLCVYFAPKNQPAEEHP